MTSLTREIGRVEAIFRYPVKSMAGERVEVAQLGWHGIAGDRRLAVRRTQERSGFPWLTASKLPDLLLFTPLRHENGVQGDLPTHVRTPEGNNLPVFSEELSANIERRHGAPVEMMHLRDGIFDEAAVSVITTETVLAIGEAAGIRADVRRFRPNIVVRLLRPIPFQEDEWQGRVLVFGEPDDGPRVSVTMRDARCSIVNLDPDSACSAPAVLKAVVRTNQNNAGVYGTVIRTGQVATGQTIHLQEWPEQHERHLLTIERAKVDDVDLVKQVLSETWIDTYASYMSRATIEQVTTLWHDRELLRSQIEKSGDYFAVAKQDGKIVGLITVIVVGPKELHLPRLYVHPEHQRKGIGTRLLQAALAQYPNAMVVRLEVEQQNAKGLSYWRKQRFVEVGTSVEQIGAERIEVVTMERRLQ